MTCVCLAVSKFPTGARWAELRSPCIFECRLPHTIQSSVPYTIPFRATPVRCGHHTPPSPTQLPTGARRAELRSLYGFECRTPYTIQYTVPFTYLPYPTRYIASHLTDCQPSFPPARGGRSCARGTASSVAASGAPARRAPRLTSCSRLQATRRCIH